MYDRDFEMPVAATQVMIVETEVKTTASDQGNFLLTDVPPGAYTLVFSKESYAREVRSNVIVRAGQLTEIEVWLSGEITVMEEFIVQSPQFGGGELQLLELRFDSPALLDSISADQMSLSGASDAASALNLVAGASVQEGKFAVIRGLPDRYVNSQMNGVRLPTADEDKRAVQLDQFPSAVIDSIQVSKTFTPDQQGDASGGAVNIVLKGIPDQPLLQFKSQIGYNTQVGRGNEFLRYKGGGVNFWGNDRGSRDIPFGGMFDGAVGVSRGDSPIDHKWSTAFGGNKTLDNGLTIGGFASFFYERDSSYHDDGIDDSLWVVDPGEPLTPVTLQGTPPDDFKTALFDVTQGTELVQWGGLGTIGLETENHSLGFTYLYTRIAEDTATLAEDTRGKAFFFPGYDPDDPTGIGNTPDDQNGAPYIRTETLQYTERTTETLQLTGRHRFPLEDAFSLLAIELDWSIANSTADQYQPDKRQFGSLWLVPSFNPGFPPFIPPSTSPATHFPFKPAANFTLGNLQRIWKDIEEESEQYAVNLKLPFTQWTGSEGYLKFGVFDDEVTRTFDQDTFSNFNDNSAQFQADWDQFWSAVFPFETHPIMAGPPFVDVDYEGNQSISAWYSMIDLPLSSSLNVIGGARFESTSIGIVNFPEQDAMWFPSGALAPVQLQPGDADVAFKQDDVLPSIGLRYTPTRQLTLRASYSETIARQTFKELTPIQQQEFLGGPVFIGNPELRMSELTNYDLRLDYTPYEGGLMSVSWFRKDIERPIEYVQRVAEFTFTTPVNYPRGALTGFELEFRQHLGEIWEGLDGLSIGANATFIDSEVDLPPDEAVMFSTPNIMVPMSSRDMTNAPEHLYNLYLTYDLAATGTQIGLFYTVKGDTLIAGAGQSDGNFVPSVYALEFDTLNFSLTQKIGEHIKLQLQAKNLTDPRIEEVYRSGAIGSDITKTSYSRGIDYSIGISAQFTF